MRITLIIEIPSIKSKKEGMKFASGLADHVVEHCNQDNIIHQIFTRVPGQEKGEA